MIERPILLKERFAAEELANARQAEFEAIVEKDRRKEWRLLWSEVLALILLVDFALWALGLSYQGL